MEVGDRVLDRWQLVARVSSRDGVERWRAVALDTGEPAEVLVGPRSDARARAEFVDLHGVLTRVRDPALAHTLAVRPGERPIAVRTPLEAATLDAIAAPLESATVAWIGSRLLPAVLAAGPATRGALRPSDLALDAAGHPVVAPPIEPMTRVALGSTRAVAPEAFGGRAPDAAAGLYGLGVLLYRLATGKDPPTVGTRATRPPPPPPSALRHGIPEALDRAVLRLLSNDPGQRAGALPLLQEIAGPPVDLRTRTRPASPASIPILTTISDGAGPAPGDPAQRWRAGREGAPAPGLGAAGPEPGGLVLIDARALAALDPAARSRAAGVAGVGVRHIEELIARSLPLVLATTPSRTAAGERAAAVARETGLPVTAAAPVRFPAWIVGAAGTAAALVPALLALILLLVGWVPGAVGLGLVAAVILALAGGAAARQVGAGRLHASGRAALARSREAAAARSGGGLLDPAWRRLAETRIELARADLPPAPAADLRGALKDLEERLEALAHLSETAERTLRQVDLSALRTRLATAGARAGVDPARRAERDRLARTVADLEAVEASRASIGPAARRIEDALSEISAVLAQLEADEDAALARIDTVARRARDAAEPAAPKAPGPVAGDRAGIEAGPLPEPEREPVPVPEPPQAHPTDAVGAGAPRAGDERGDDEERAALQRAARARAGQAGPQ